MTEVSEPRDKQRSVIANALGTGVVGASGGMLAGGMLGVLRSVGHEGYEDGIGSAKKRRGAQGAGHLTREIERLRIKQLRSVYARNIIGSAAKGTAVGGALGIGAGAGLALMDRWMRARESKWPENEGLPKQASLDDLIARVILGKKMPQPRSSWLRKAHHPPARAPHGLRGAAVT